MFECWPVQWGEQMAIKRCSFSNIPNCQSIQKNSWVNNLTVWQIQYGKLSEVGCLNLQICAITKRLKPLKQMRARCSLSQQLLNTWWLWLKVSTKSRKRNGKIRALVYKEENSLYNKILGLPPQRRHALFHTLLLTKADLRVFCNQVILF